MIDLSTVQNLTIDGSDFTDKQFVVISVQRVDTGAGALKSLMSLPLTLLNVFGTGATFFLNAASSYDPDTGEAAAEAQAQIKAKIYPEAYTAQERSSAPEILNGDVKVYAPGTTFGYTTSALLILQVREVGGSTSRLRV